MNVLVFIAIVCFLLTIVDSKSLSSELSQRTEGCTRKSDQSAEPFDTYWINLDQSVERKVDMTEYFEFAGFSGFHHRVSAITPEEIEIPSGLGRPINCRFIDDGAQYRRLRRMKMEAIAQSTKRAGSNDTHSLSPPKKLKRILLTGHCGRPKNIQTELAVTLSHLLAIDQAVKDPNSKSKYALIMEDDVQFPFEIDFYKLIETAPKEFAVLQLVTSNELIMYDALKQYMVNDTNWIHRTSRLQAWCAGAYIIDKDMLRPIISTLIQHEDYGIIRANVMAVDMSQKKSDLSCWNHDGTAPNLPCIYSPYGYEADQFLYNFFPNQTYLLTTPIATASKSAWESTIHQNHVKSHFSAFLEIQRAMAYLLLPIYYAEMKLSSRRILGHFWDHFSLPPFITDDCIRECHFYAAGLCRRNMLQNQTQSRDLVRHVQNEVNKSYLKTTY